MNAANTTVSFRVSMMIIRVIVSRAGTDSRRESVLLNNPY
jgi:hypothetical protein